MHEIKKSFMQELEEYDEKARKMGGAKFSMQDLDKIHKLTDTVKNICKIDMLSEDEGYSEASDWMGEGRMYGQSYAGRYNARRDSRGRYSRADGMSDRGEYSYNYNQGNEHLMKKIDSMLDSAENERQREAIERFKKEMERI